MKVGCAVTELGLEWSEAGQDWAGLGGQAGRVPDDERKLVEHIFFLGSTKQKQTSKVYMPTRSRVRSLLPDE